jgi:hypothetical protein
LGNRAAAIKPLAYPSSRPYARAMDDRKKTDADKPVPAEPPASEPNQESGGPKGPEPTRYGDWERNGRVSDF